MNSQLMQYRPSGRSRPIAVAYALGVMLAGLLTGGVYQFVQNLLPSLYLKFCLVGGLAMVTMGLTLTFSMAGHVRSRGLALSVAGATALCVLLASYAWGYLGAVRAILAARPQLTFQDVLEGLPVMSWVQFRVEHGWTSNRNGSLQGIDGFEVYLAWFTEALLVFTFALLPAWMSQSTPYCEHCEQWMLPADGFRLAGLGHEVAQPLLDVGDMTRLLALPGSRDAEELPCLSFTCRTCPSKQHTALTLNEGRLTKGMDGQLRLTFTPLVKHVLLTPEQQKLLSARVLEQEQAEASAEPAAP